MYYAAGVNLARVAASEVECPEHYRAVVAAEVSLRDCHARRPNDRKIKRNSVEVCTVLAQKEIFSV